jgi:hypothetical protein
MRRDSWVATAVIFQALFQLRQLLLGDAADVFVVPVLFQQAARLLVQEPKAQLQAW